MPSAISVTSVMAVLLLCGGPSGYGSSSSARPLRARCGHVLHVHLDRVVDETDPTVPTGVVGGLLDRQPRAERGEQVERARIGDADACEQFGQASEVALRDRV